MADFPKGIDARQIVSRDLLQQVFPHLSNQQLDLLLRSIDKDLQVPMRVDASSTPDYVVSIGPAIVDNTVSGRQKSISHVQSVVPAFTSGTVTFPAASGGNITASTGGVVALTLPVNEYVKVLLSLDSSSNIVITVGTSDASEVSAQVPAPVADTLAFAYVTVFNNAGVIDPIAQNKIYQFAGGGGGSGGATPNGYAREEDLISGSTSFTVVFPVAQSGVNFVPDVAFANYDDPDPQFQAFTITGKTVNGFTVTWNDELETGNYKLNWRLPAVQSFEGEKAVSAGVSTMTIDLPFDYGNTNYIVFAQLVNISGDSPQFQTAMLVGRTNTTFTVDWNDVTDSANYRLAYKVSQIQ